MEDEVVFGASMSTKNRLITCGVGWGVLLGVPTSLGLLFAVGMGETGALFLPAMAVAGMGLIQAFRTRGCAVDREGVTVKRILRPLSIPPEELAEVRTDPGAPEVTVHRRALNGFYGMHGTFWNRDLGNFRMYVTNPDNVVEIVTREGGHVFISPDDTSGFVSHLETQLRESGSDAVITGDGVEA